MTNLRYGMVDIYGCQMNGHPDIEEFEKYANENDDVSKINGYYLKGHRTTYLGGFKFRPEVIIPEGETPMYIFTPVAKRGLVTRADVQDWRRHVSDTVLLKLLGKPTRQTDSETVYEFAWGEIKAVSHLGLDIGCDAGYIVITYED